MGPRGRLSAAERREQILSAALPLFANHGRNGVTTKQIADACGISEALIYRHFASKEALFEALQGYCVSEAERASKLDGLKPSTSSLVVGLYWLFRWVLIGGEAGTEHNKQVLRLILASLVEDGAFARGFYRKNTVPMVDLLFACLEAAEASGDRLPDAGPPKIRDVWRAHACAAGLSAVVSSEPPVIELEWPLETLIVDTVRFALLGLGLRPEAIDRHLNAEALALLQG